jgi:hypothetical protein
MLHDALSFRVIPCGHGAALPTRAAHAPSAAPARRTGRDSGHTDRPHGTGHAAPAARTGRTARGLAWGMPARADINHQDLIRATNRNKSRSCLRALAQGEAKDAMEG